MKTRIVLGAMMTLFLSANLSAQLPYDHTVFLPGLGDPARWYGFGAPQALGTVINFGGGYSTPQASNSTSSVDAQSVDFRAQLYGTHNVLVGHSMGGVVARNLLTSPNPAINAASKIYGIVTVASPHFGAPIAASAHQYNFAGRAFVEGFFEDFALVILNPLLAFFNAVMNFLVESFKNNVLYAIKAIVAQLAGASSPGATDLQPSSATIQRLSTTLDTRPHATVTGTIPARDAVYRVFGGIQGGSGQSAINDKNRVRNAMHTCRLILYNFIVKTSWGHRCYGAERAIDGIDQTWNNWTHGPNKAAAFDGFLPVDYTRYPGTSVSSPLNLTAPGSNHFTIVQDANGRARIADAMRQIGMVDR